MEYRELAARRTEYLESAAARRYELSIERLRETDRAISGLQDTLKLSLSAEQKTRMTLSGLRSGEGRVVVNEPKRWGHLLKQLRSERKSVVDTGRALGAKELKRQGDLTSVVKEKAELKKCQEYGKQQRARIEAFYNTARSESDLDLQAVYRMFGRHATASSAKTGPLGGTNKLSSVRRSSCGEHDLKSVQVENPGMVGAPNVQMGRLDSPALDGDGRSSSRQSSHSPNLDRVEVASAELSESGSVLLVPTPKELGAIDLKASTTSAALLSRLRRTIMIVSSGQQQVVTISHSLSPNCTVAIDIRRSKQGEIQITIASDSGALSATDQGILVALATQLSDSGYRVRTAPTRRRI